MNNLKKRRIEQIRTVIKWLLMFLTASAAYILMTAVPVSFPLPLLFLPMAVAVASKEEPFNAGLWGCVCGLMTDSALDKLFGFNAVIFTFAAVLISLLFQYILRQNILNIAMLNFILIPLWIRQLCNRRQLPEGENQWCCQRRRSFCPAG